MDAKERERLAALRKETAKRPVATVRPDYFGTAEHRASAEQLARMLAGEPVFSKAARADPRAAARGEPPTPCPTPCWSGPGSRVASADPAWREPFLARLEDLMARYRPLTELEIRPGLTLTYGEVVALAGDYYATPEELTAELTPRVAEAIRGVTPQDEGTFLLNTHRGWFDYASLANENQDHFAPRSWARYAQHHAEALRLARRSQPGRGAGAQRLRRPLPHGCLRLGPPARAARRAGGTARRGAHAEDARRGERAGPVGAERQRLRLALLWGRPPGHQPRAPDAHRVRRGPVAAARLQGLPAGGRGAQALHRRARRGLRKLELTAGEMVDPRTLPRFLGPIAGLPDIRDHLPVPLGIVDEPDTANVLGNYPPQVGLDGKKRKETPDFEAYFRFE